MNDQQLTELFTAHDEPTEPPLPPGYVEETLGRGRRAGRRRSIRNSMLSGVAALAVLAGLGAVAPHLWPSENEKVLRTYTADGGGRADGGGPYDALVQRIRPGWLPDDWDLFSVSNDRRMETVRFGKGYRYTKKGKVYYQEYWDLELRLYWPGREPGSDGPLEHIRFGDGTRVDPIQGMPAERLPDPNGYTLSWTYPSGAHGVVTLMSHHSGLNVPDTARRTAENMSVDGTTPLRFPFTIKPAPKEQVDYASNEWMHLPQKKKASTLAMIAFSPGQMPAAKGVQVAPSRGGKPGSSDHGRYYTLPSVHGYFVGTRDPGGHAKQFARTVHVFGYCDDMSTWRPHPLR